MEENKQSLTPDGSIVGYGMDKVTQAEANYTPFGFSDQEGCGNCKWFAGYENRCHVVDGIIVPTGKSDLYRPLFPQDQMAELLEDFAEEMSEMDMGEASISEEKQQKPSLIARLFSRKNKLEDKPLFDTPTGFKVVGDNYWIMWYSNPYKDRDDEHFAEKSLDADIAYMNEQGEYPQLWRYHIGQYPHNPASKHGEAFAVTKAGRFVIAFGEFDDTPLGKAFKEYYKDNPDQGVSHGFYYDPAFKKDGVYYKHHTFEVSTLPPEVAANPYTSFGIKEGTKEMAANEKQLADLKAVLNGKLSEKEIDQVLQAASQKSAELDQHVSHKAEKEDEKAKEPELSADTKALLGALGEIKSSMSTMSTAFTELKAKMDKEDMEDEEDEEYEGGKKPKKKQRETADTLSPEITKMLRTLVEDQQLNQDSKAIEERELDGVTFTLAKMFGGGQS